MKPLSQIRQENKEEFEKEFGKLTLGILSGEKGSPVFVNNDLEVPRLKSFLTLSESRIISAIRKWAEKMDEESTTRESKKTAPAGINYEIGYSTALSDILSYLNEADKK